MGNYLWKKKMGCIKMGNMEVLSVFISTDAFNNNFKERDTLFAFFNRRDNGYRW